MTQIATKIWTYDDYLQLPDDGNRYEIIEGELYVSPAPTTDHQYSSGELFFLLKDFVRRNQLGELYYAPYEVHLAEDSRPVQPDLLFIRTENAPKGGTPYFVGIPDLVVEILSRSSIRLDTNTKFNLYEKAGIPEYWIVDPKARTVRVFVLDEGIYRVWGEYSGDEVITSNVLVLHHVSFCRNSSPIYGQDSTNLQHGGVLAGLEIVNSTLFKS